MTGQHEPHKKQGWTIKLMTGQHEPHKKQGGTIVTSSFTLRIVYV
jgi:hypothetical protein